MPMFSEEELRTVRSAYALLGAEFAELAEEVYDDQNWPAGVRIQFTGNDDGNTGSWPTAIPAYRKRMAALLLALATARSGA